MSLNLRLAFLFNTRRVSNPNDPNFSLEADFDDSETIRVMTSHFEALGCRVLPIEADETAYEKLYKNKKEIDLVFNYAEGRYGADREAQLPAILEMLQIPYTGSGPLTQVLGLNKVKAKEVLSAHGVATLPFQLFKSGDETWSQELAFPVIVKPVAQGSSAGITNDSVVETETALRAQVKKIISQFNQPALVEPFLIGREFSVAMLGNPPQILPIIEANHATLPKKYKQLDSLEVKWLYEESGETGHLICPAQIEESLRKKIEEIVMAAWNYLEVRDWCRMDIRCDTEEKPYFLEMNSPAGMIPPEVSTTSYFPLAARAAEMEYEQLLETIITTARVRHGK